MAHRARIELDAGGCDTLGADFLEGTLQFFVSFFFLGGG